MIPPIFWSWRGVPLGEENFPVGVAGADEGQGGGAGIGHVGTDVGEIFEEPEAAKSEGGGFTLPEEIDSAQEGHEQFAERPPRIMMLLPNQLKKNGAS